ncbi:MAG: twin-arginine translocase subunit TatC [Candidatus Omnitrophota bacterium]
MTLDRRMTLVEHLEEVRRRLLICLAAVFIASCAAFWKVRQIVSYLSRPVGSLVFLSPTEAFMAYLKVAFFAGLFISSPVLLCQIWGFISPALERKEKRTALFLFPAAAILFLGGAAFAFFLVIPFALKFLINFSGPEVIAVFSISAYLSFVIMLVIMFGVVFELPVVVIILAKLGLITPSFLSRNRKYAVLVIFITAAVLTPTPDAFTQTLMAVPMIFLYEISIWMAKLVVRPGSPLENKII